jgi:hypothetical protein
VASGRPDEKAVWRGPPAPGPGLAAAVWAEAGSHSSTVRVTAACHLPAPPPAHATRRLVSPPPPNKNSDESVRAAAKAVAAAVGADGLQGLINNAGVSMSYPVEFFPSACGSLSA